ncbi:MAG: DUF4058 family protein [Fimbriiglobus sp.]|jgi:hypothetical protein|nr:DUF4058 family protein [Fimbriiglobus sp.]
MPLLDHFHPPLEGRRHWESFHAQWAGTIAAALNEHLPPDYFAESQVHVGPRIEVDVGTFDDAPAGGGGVATAPQVRPTLAPPDLVLPAVFPPDFGVRVYEGSGGPRLVAAIELVSPGNKDRAEKRTAFAAKCVSHLTAGCGVMIVDVVTSRLSRPLDDLFPLLAPGVPVPDHGPLSAASFRPLRQGETDSIEVRHRTLTVGGVLPELPLALDAGQFILVDLEAAYEEARARSRL